MLPLKSSKHRCQCYSHSSGSFLYGLRREAPSTERVLLERLLNILSRAAAHKNRNPQRLWAESERPEWWTKVTELPWKNPREHPKDNKDTLKKKINILEKELRERNLMTSELEEELEIHRDGKKIDLELKSDFEAIITKASGLHFMLDKVYSKMGQSRIISDKIATYIKETKSCVDKVHKKLSLMYDQVQAREERKQDLWSLMGVSKDQRTVVLDEVETDSIKVDSDLEFYDILDPNSILSPKLTFLEHPTSPFSTGSSLSPQSPDLLDSASVQKPRATVSPLSSDLETPFEPIVHLESPPASSQPPKSDQDLIATHPKSAYRPVSTLTDPEALQSVGLSQHRPSSVSFSLSVPKRNWQQSANDSEEFQVKKIRAKSPRLHQPSVRSVAHDVIVIGEEDNDGHLSDQTKTTSVLPGSGSGTWRGKDANLDLFTKHQTTLPARTKSEPPSVTHRWPTRKQPDVSLSAGWQRPGATKPARMASSRPEVTAELTTLPMDVTVDAGDDFEEVEAILEESETPTVSMYTLDTSGMDQLADLTRALSCDDLSPSVTESVMTGELPVRSISDSAGSAHFGASRKLSQPSMDVKRGSEKQPGKDVDVGVSVERKPRTLLTGGSDQRKPIFLAGSAFHSQQPVAEWRNPEQRPRFVPLSALPTSVHVRSTHWSGKEGNGEQSLSRAIGDLSGHL